MVCPDGRMVWSHVSGGFNPVVKYSTFKSLVCVCMFFMDCVGAKSAPLGLFSPSNSLGMKSKGKYPATGWVDPGFLWNGITGAAERGTGFWVSRLSTQNLSDSYSGYTVCVFIVNSFYYFIVLKFLFTLGNTLGKNYSDSYSVRQCYMPNYRKKIRAVTRDG